MSIKVALVVLGLVYCLGIGEGKICKSNACQELPTKTHHVESFSWDNATVDDLMSVQFNLPPEERKGTLFLGMTGAGKSTLTLLTVGDLDTVSVMRATGTCDKRVVHDMSDDSVIGHDPKSKTLIPTRHAGDGHVIYDCPGFGDSRGPMSDIVANLYLKKLTSHLSSVKLVFVVREKTLQMGERYAFDDFLNYVVRFLPGLHRHRSSFRMVINRASRFTFLDDEVVPRSPETVVEEAAQYLSAYLDVLRERANALRDESESTPEAVELEAKMNLTQWLLETSVDEDDREPRFYRIGVSYELSKCGKLSNNTVALGTRDATRTMLSELPYAEINVGDFGYSLKTETVQQIYHKYNQEATNFAKALLSNMTEDGARNVETDILQGVSTIDGTYRNVTNLLNVVSCKSGNETLTLSEIFQECTIPLMTLANVSTKEVQSFKEKIEKSDEVLNFYQEMTNSSGLAGTMQHTWRDDLQKTSQSIRDLAAWYRGVQNVAALALSYESRRRVLVGQPSMTNWTEGSAVARQFDPTFPTDVEIAASIDALHRDRAASFLRALCTLPEVFVEGQKVQVNGPIIYASDIASIDLSDVDEVHVYASESFVLDYDLDFMARGISLFMVAPKLQLVAGNSKGIYLDGKKGAQNSQDGGHGGTFVGIFDSVIGNGGMVTVSANGGNGGDGSPGEAGARGWPGTDLRYNEVPSAMNLGGRQPDIRKDTFFLIAINSQTHIYLGGYGGYGGNGRNGGNGGKGGDAGSVLINVKQTETKRMLRTQQSPGSGGRGGRGGVGGAGGKRGNGWSCSMKNLFILLSKYDCSEYYDYSAAPDGSNGMNGVAGTSGRGPVYTSISNLAGQIDLLQYESATSSFCVTEGCEAFRKTWKVLA